MRFPYTLLLILAVTVVFTGCTYVDDIMDRLAPIFQMDTPVEPDVIKPV
jgi:precorrin-4 methylase